LDAFESLIAMLLRHQGYWTAPSFKVELTKEEKRQIGRPSSPRWELDLIAYKPSANEILAVECKSYLDSTGVIFRNGKFEPESSYKLFSEKRIWPVVSKRLTQQLRDAGSCTGNLTATLCLAIGKMAKKTDRSGLISHFQNNGYLLFGPDWVIEQLLLASQRGYENDVAFIVSKLLLRNQQVP